MNRSVVGTGRRGFLVKTIVFFRPVSIIFRLLVNVSSMLKEF